MINFKKIVKKGTIIHTKKTNPHGKKHERGLLLTH